MTTTFSVFCLQIWDAHLLLIHAQMKLIPISVIKKDDTSVHLTLYQG